MYVAPKSMADQIGMKSVEQIEDKISTFTVDTNARIVKNVEGGQQVIAENVDELPQAKMHSFNPAAGNKRGGAQYGKVVN